MSMGWRTGPAIVEVSLKGQEDAIILLIRVLTTSSDEEVSRPRSLGLTQSTPASLSPLQVRDSGRGSLQTPERSLRVPASSSPLFLLYHHPDVIYRGDDPEAHHSLPLCGMQVAGWMLGRAPFYEELLPKQ